MSTWHNYNQLAIFFFHCICKIVVIYVHLQMYCIFHKDMVPDSDSILSGHYNPVPHCMGNDDYTYQH